MPSPLSLQQQTTDDTHYMLIYKVLFFACLHIAMHRACIYCCFLSSQCLAGPKPPPSPLRPSSVLHALHAVHVLLEHLLLALLLLGRQHARIRAASKVGHAHGHLLLLLSLLLCERV